MDGEGLGLAERRSAMAAAAESLVGFEEALPEASDEQLGAVMAEADSLAARAQAARAMVAVEAVKRGVVAGSGMNAHAWVREHAPSLRQGGAGQVARLVTEVANVARSAGSLAPDAAAQPDPASALGMVWAGVKDASVSPGLALSAMGEVVRLEPKLDPHAVPLVVEGLLELGTVWGAGQMRKLRPAMLAKYGVPGELDDVQERLAGAARLSQPWVESGDMTEYQLVVTPEQAAVLEAAIGPLSAPAPNEETGERDLRPAGQRRVEALTEVCRRASGSDADSRGAEGAGASGVALHVTVALSDLQELTGAGEVLGSAATGVLLLLSWADGGLSDMDNAALLLCQRHHTFVHTRRLWGDVRSTPDELGRYVVWDLHPGSYDRHLEHVRRERAEHDPPPLSRQRLLELLTAVTSSDEAERRLAVHDLDLLSDAENEWQQQATVNDHDPEYRAWQEAYLTGVGAAHHTAA